MYIQSDIPTAMKVTKQVMVPIQSVFDTVMSRTELVTVRVQWDFQIVMNTTQLPRVRIHSDLETVNKCSGNGCVAHTISLFNKKKKEDRIQRKNNMQKRARRPEHLLSRTEAEVEGNYNYSWLLLQQLSISFMFADWKYRNIKWRRYESVHLAVTVVFICLFISPFVFFPFTHSLFCLFRFST